MRHAEFDVVLSLIIRTKESCDYISNIMSCKPTKEIKLKSKVFDSEEEDSNIWVLRERYENCTELGIIIQKFINGIEDLAKKIEYIKKHGICAIRISVISLYGQLGFSFTEKDLSLLSELQIPLELSFFSYGNCIAE